MTFNQKRILAYGAAALEGTLIGITCAQAFGGWGLLAAILIGSVAIIRAVAVCELEKEIQKNGENDQE